MHVHQFHVNAETGDIQQTISLGFFDRDLQPQQSADQVLEAPVPGKAGQSPPKYYVKSHYSEGSKCLLEDQVAHTSCLWAWSDRHDSFLRVSAGLSLISQLE